VCERLRGLDKVHDARENLSVLLSHEIQISKYEIQVQRKQTLLFHGLVRFNQDTILQYVHNLAGVAVEFSDGDASLKPDSWLVFETHRPHEGGTYLYVHNAYFSESCSDKQVFYYC